MSKEKTLIKNTAIIAIGSLSTKILTFLLLPLYTAVLTTEDYGIIDLLMTVSGLIIPFASLEMSSGVFRFIIDNNEVEERKAIISTAIIAELAGLTISIVVIFLFGIAYPIPYVNVFVFYMASMTLVRLVSDIARGFGDNVIYSFSNFVVTLVSLLLNLFFILVLGMKGESILLAASIGNICGMIIILFKEKVWVYFSLRSISKKVFKSITTYTIPLIPNTVFWWIVSASDRIIIVFFLGASANGIYAAANKIPGIYTTIFSVYSLAWTEAVARNVNDNEFVSTIFHKSLNVMMYMLLGMVTCASLFFHILIGYAYSESYWHVFILLLAIFFSSISSLLGGIFAGQMESKMVFQTTLIGAIANIIINVVFIRVCGLYAASLSTLVAYGIVFLLRYVKCKSWYNLKIFEKRDFIIGGLFAVAVVGYALSSRWINIILIPIIIGVFLYNNKDSLIGFFVSIKKRIGHK